MSTTSDEADLGGPSATVTIPSGGATVVLGVGFEAYDTLSSPPNQCPFARVVDATDSSLSELSIGACAISYTPFSGAKEIFVANTTQNAHAVTFSMRYSDISSGDSAFFCDRTLSATVLK